MTPRRLSLVCVVLIAVVLGLMPGCASHEDAWKDKGGPPRVVVTFPPLVSFVKSVAGDHAGVVCLCTSTGPHEYTYNVKDLIVLGDADLFVANGLGLDDKFADRLHTNLRNQKCRYIKLGDNLDKKLLQEPRHEEEEEKGAKDHKHGEHDPHIWLGIPQARAMVEQIRDALKKADPGHTKDYDSNAEAYLKKLDGLKKRGEELLKGKEIKLISFHESLDYFAPTYGVKIVDVIEVAPGEPPTGKRLAELLKLCKKENIKVIAVEPQYPRTTAAEVLRKELEKEKVAVKLVEIDPLETCEKTEDLNAGWYERKIEENLKTLAEAMK